MAIDDFAARIICRMSVIENLMADILRKPLTGPSVWHGKEFTQDLSWVHELSEIDIRDLDSALIPCKEYWGDAR